LTRTASVATAAGLIALHSPDPALITLAAIAQNLARINRWLGATELPISVAQHSLGVGNALPARMRIYGILHDGHEYVWGDVMTPTAVAIERDFPGFCAWLDSRKTDMDIAIRRAFGVPEPTIDTLAAVHDADLRMAATEWASLMPAANGHNPIPAEPYRSIRIKPWAWPEAEAQFRQAVERELALKSWEQAA
jgi:hypothetical protein